MDQVGAGGDSPDKDGPARPALRPGDPALSAVRARLVALAWSLWQARVLDAARLPLAPAPADPPVLWLLAPLWRRLRLQLLAGEFFGSVLPGVERWLSAAGRQRQRRAGLTPAGPVDWPATWRRALVEATPAPRTLITRHWWRELDLPENRLVALALASLAADAREAQAAALPPAERRTITALAGRVDAALAAPPWNRFSPHLDTWLRAPEPLAEAAVAAVRAMAPPQRRTYAALLGWWHRYRHWRQTTLGATPRVSSELEPDLLFELLVLLELVTALARHVPVHQARPLAGSGAEPTRPLFRAYHAAGELAIFYQTGSMFAQHRRLSSVWGTPDIVIRLPDERFVIVDAKNYAPGHHSQALYKLMGYLYNFGYNPRFLPDRPPAEALFHSFERVVGGLLVFPSPEREGHDLHPWHAPADTGQAIYSLVLPPLPDERFRGLETFTTWLLAAAEGQS